MSLRPLWLAWVCVLGALAPRAASAQEAFRSADLDRPLRVEDANPIERGEWELESGLRAGFGEDDRVEAVVELKTGPFWNTQVGVELHGGWERESLGDEEEDHGGLESAGIHALIGFNRETWSWPAFSARVDVETPGAGGLGRDAWAASVKGIATRSFDRLRLHANGGYTVAEAADGGDFWRAGLALDYPIGLFSRTVMADVYAEIPTGEEDARVWTTIGTRWQWTNTTVLDFGVGGRVDRWVDGKADVEIVVGIGRALGWTGLLEVPPYPDPKLD
ncbi:MAG: hypothetical protein R3326_04000 [Gemmatimonadota bacterium]|nr:hypothetical protein [Gemmatimonadota bacterium]